VVVYGCTSGSFFEGPEWNAKICAQLTDITGAPTVTTAGAMAECLVAGGHKKVAVVTPYVELTNERLKDFLRAFGIRVTHLGTFDMLDMFDHAKILPEEIYRKVRESDSDEAEALFVACTQLRALEVLDLLERDLGKPVYSAIQATAWQAYATLGIDPGIRDCGSLLRRLSEPGAAKPAVRPRLQKSA
jgi:maleate cis-trans isomerase